MDRLRDVVDLVVGLAASYRPGTITEAEHVVDTYLVAFHGYLARKAAIDALVDELHSPSHRARNRGGLFEQVELHLRRRQREMAREFQ